MTTTATCPVCGNPQAQGLLDDKCTTALERELGDVAAIVAELDITLSRQARIGSGDGKMGKGWAREKLPIHIGAIEAADVLQNTLTTWARDVDEVGFLAEHSTSPSAAAARILLNHVSLIRRHPAVVELVDEITDAIRKARHTIDKPADRKFFGTCLAEFPDPEGRLVTCLEEIWASPSASEVTCKVCGIEHEIAERREWLMDKAKEMFVTTPEAATYVGRIGHMEVTQASIRGYIRRDRLLFRTPMEARRFRLGDLLDLLREDAERAEKKASLLTKRKAHVLMCSTSDPSAEAS